MALGGAVQGVFVLVAVLFYSAIVWRSLDRHFGEEYKKHLSKDYKNIQKMKQDRIAVIKSNVETAKVPDDVEHFTQVSAEDTSQKPSVQGNCKGENNPAKKYLGQSEEVDDGMCPFNPPIDQKNANDGG